MQKFRFVSHTADMEFIGYGSNMPMMIENCAAALLSVMLDVKSIGKNASKEASIAISEIAYDPAELVWFTLQDTLSKIDSRKLSATALRVLYVRKLKNGKLKLKARLYYKKTKSDYSLLLVKAVTPHGLKVAKKKGIYSAHVVIDV